MCTVPQSFNMSHGVQHEWNDGTGKDRKLTKKRGSRFLEGEVVVSNLCSADISQNCCRSLCYRKMQEISLASGWKFVTLVTLQAPLLLCGSEKVLSRQDLWVFTFLESNLRRIRTVIKLITEKQNNIKKKNQSFGLTYWFFLFSLCYRCLSLIILRHKVQIVLGSQLILQIHPLEAYTIAWTFGRLHARQMCLCP